MKKIAVIIGILAFLNSGAVFASHYMCNKHNNMHHRYSHHIGYTKHIRYRYINYYHQLPHSGKHKKVDEENRKKVSVPDYKVYETVQTIY